MPAVGEAAVRRQLCDVLERRLESVVGEPEVHLAHAGVVDEEPTTGEEDELPPRRRVPAGAVGADVACRKERLVAGEPVDQGGLPDSQGPRRAPVTPEPISERIPSRPTFVLLETKWIGIAPPTPSSSAATDSGSVSRSAFVRTIAGRAPLCSASVT